MLEENQVGRRIRSLRLARNLTQQALADEANITKGYLSKIENAGSAPPVSTLLHLAGALGVTMDAFFSLQEPNTFYTLVKKNDRKKLTRDNDPFGYTSESVAQKFPNRIMEPTIMTFPLNIQTKIFQHKGQEFIMILEGKMRLKLGDEELMLYEEDCIYFNATVPHSGKPLGDKAVTFLSVICLGGFEIKTTEGDPSM